MSEYRDSKRFGFNEEARANHPTTWQVALVERENVA